MFLTESERLQTIKACRDCPMCHPVDMFAHVTGKEANTPRGRGMTFGDWRKGFSPGRAREFPEFFIRLFWTGFLRNGVKAITISMKWSSMPEKRSWRKA